MINNDLLTLFPQKKNFIASQSHCVFEPKELRAHNKSQGIHLSTKKKN